MKEMLFALRLNELLDFCLPLKLWNYILSPRWI